MTYTRDGLFERTVTVVQPEKGYRYNIDSVLLGHFAASVKPKHVVDLGAGSGIVGFALLASGAGRVTGIEIDPVLAEGCRQGIEANDFVDRYHLIEGDLRDRSVLAGIGHVDLIVSNPPYRRTDSGLVSPDESKARARHDGSCTLEDLLDAAASMLETRGRLCVVLPPERMETFVTTAAERRLHLSRIRPVYPKQDRDARMVLMEARFDTSDQAASILPPLVLHDAEGNTTPEASSILSCPQR